MRLFQVSMAGVFLLLAPGLVMACPYCDERALVWGGIFNREFLGRLFQVLVPLPVLLGAAVVGGRLLARGEPLSPRRPMMTAGIVLGIGMGGFVDGIVLHMLLQWHNLFSNWIPPVDFVSLEINMFWDGVFKAGMWILTMIGIGLMWRTGSRGEAIWSGWLLSGALLIGWGIFNVFDSIVFHWILNAHHIKPGENWLLYDIGFFLSGLMLMVGGWFVARRE